MKIIANLIPPQFVPSVEEILNSNLLCTISSIGGRGEPHSKTAYFAADDSLDVIILTQPSTRHGQNVQVDKRVSLTIFDSSQVWGQPHKGLQLSGVCSQVPDLENPAAFECYASKHPALLELASSSDVMLRDLESRFFRVNVGAIRLIDEARFGEETHFDMTVDPANAEGDSGNAK